MSWQRRKAAREATQADRHARLRHETWSSQVWREENRERVAANQRAWARQNRERIFGYALKALKPEASLFTVFTSLDEHNGFEGHVAVYSRTPLDELIAKEDE